MFGGNHLAVVIAVATQHLLVVFAVGDHNLFGICLLSAFLITPVLCTVGRRASGGLWDFAVTRGKDALRRR